MNNYSEDQDVQLVRQIKAKKDYYSILGVEKSSSTEEIKKAYRNLSLKVHPDQNKAPGSEEAFKKVSEAYSHLRNEESRRQYDLRNEESRRQYDLSRRAADYDFQTSNQQWRRWHDPSSRAADEFHTSNQQWRRWHDPSRRAADEFHASFQQWRMWHDLSRRADEFQTSNPRQYHDVRRHSYTSQTDFGGINSFYDGMVRSMCTVLDSADDWLDFVDAFVFTRLERCATIVSTRLERCATLFSARLARFCKSDHQAGHADGAAGAHQDC